MYRELLTRLASSVRVCIFVAVITCDAASKDLALVLAEVRRRDNAKGSPHVLEQLCR